MPILVIERNFDTDGLYPIGEVMGAKRRRIEISGADRKNRKNDERSRDSPRRFVRPMVGAMIIVSTVIVVGVVVVIVMIGVSSSVSVVMAFIVMLTCCGTAGFPKNVR